MQITLAKAIATTISIMNRYIVEVAHALMNEKNMPNYYWVEVVATAMYTMNRTPIVAMHGVTPTKKFTKRKPDLSHLKVFGCLVR